MGIRRVVLYCKLPGLGEVCCRQIGNQHVIKRHPNGEPVHQGMWWTRHYCLLIIYYYWARSIPLRDASSPVGWDTVPSGSNRFFEGMFQSVTSDFHHWFTHKWNWQKPKWCQQVSNCQKPVKRKKKSCLHHTPEQGYAYFVMGWSITIPWVL